MAIKNTPDKSNQTVSKAAPRYVTTGDSIPDDLPMGEDIIYDNEMTLYHYTDAKGLSGIIDSGELWATSIDYLDDPLEMDHYLRLVRDVFSAKAPKLAPSLISNDSKSKALFAAHQYLETEMSKPIIKPNTYVASLSKDGDVLSQWRAYADSGRGFAIGFSKFDDLLVRLRTTLESSTPRLSEVKYCEDAANTSAEKLSDVLLDGIDKKVADKSGDIPSTYHAAFVVTSTIQAATIKRPGFKEECEWRFLFTDIDALDRKNPSTQDVRVVDGHLAPYLRIPLGTSDTMPSINRIVVGPKNDFAKTERALRMLLANAGYGTDDCPMPEIAPSSVSLI